MNKGNGMVGSMWLPSNIGDSRFGWPKTITAVLVLALASTGFALAAASAQTSTEVYVDPAGDDRQGDGSSTRPFRSLQRAARQLDGRGGTVLVRGGTYELSTDETVSDVAGTPSSPIVIRSAPGHSPIFDGNNQAQKVIELASVRHVVIDGLTATNAKQRGMSVWDSDHVTIRNSRVSNVGERAIGGSGDHLTFENNVVWNAALDNRNAPGVVWAVAMSTWTRPNGNPSRHIVYRNNTVHDVWGEGIGALFAEDVTIDGNTIYNTYSVGVYVDTARNVRISGNNISTTSSAYNRNGRAAIGISMANEGYGGSIPLAQGFEVQDVTIRGNRIVNAGRGIGFWHDGSNPRSTNTYRNVRIENNVIQNPEGPALDFKAVPTRAIQPNNIVVRSNTIDGGAQVAQLAGWRFTGNNWTDGVPAGIPESPDSTTTTTETTTSTTGTTSPPRSTISTTEPTVTTLKPTTATNPLTSTTTKAATSTARTTNTDQATTARRGAPTTRRTVTDLSTRTSTTKSGSSVTPSSVVPDNRGGEPGLVPTNEAERTSAVEAEQAGQATDKISQQNGEAGTADQSRWWPQLMIIMFAVFLLFVSVGRMAWLHRSRERYWNP